MTSSDENMLPRSEGELEELHFELSYDLLNGTIRQIEAVAQVYGEPAAHACMRAILISSGCLVSGSALARFDEVGRRQYIDEERMGGSVDLLDQALRWVAGAAYAAQGVVHHTSDTTDIAERE